MEAVRALKFCCQLDVRDRSMSAFRGNSEFFSVCRVGPGNFTPSLSQIPDVNLSIHPARATARRLPPSIDHRVPPVAG